MASPAFFYNALFSIFRISFILKLMIVNKVKFFRERSGLTQEQLAEAVSVSRQTIIAIEKGHYEPSLSLGFKLAKKFKVSVEEVFMVK